MIGRHNQITRDNWIKQQIGHLPSGYRLLDAGAGEQPYKQLCSHLNYVSQDFAQYNGKGDGEGLHGGSWNYKETDLVCDIMDIPKTDESFDAVLCSEVIEHVPDPIRVLKELTRLLKTGGSLILTAPFCCLTHQSPYFYYTGFSDNFYNHWLSELGYRLDTVDYNGSYYDWLAQELYRVKSWGKMVYDITPIINALEIALQDDKSTHQTLCFGLMIVAIKE